MKLDDLPTPCLVLDRRRLARNLERMASAVATLGIALRPHMKTAKSADVARLARPDGGGLTVSTIAEAEYFLAHGFADIILGTAITPQKLDQVARLNAAGGQIKVVTDDAGMAAAIARHPGAVAALIEIDCGEGRSGLDADDPLLGPIADQLGDRLAGIFAHAGHSYAARDSVTLTAIAMRERQDAARAAQRLRDAGHECPIVSIGSSPTALIPGDVTGITEIRPGVYMFGDLFQAEIGTHGRDDIAVTVLTSVIGRRPAEQRLLIDAGALALSRDRSTETTAHDCGFGLVLDAGGEPSLGASRIVRVWQEHGLVQLDHGNAEGFAIGSRVRIAPNHTCLTSAAHDRYYVVDGGDDVVAVWPRIHGW
ncbi:MAG: alanine racemase [Rhodospirillales bacterium]|nr:alanine racemase [Rhodospirillales bacterium]